MCTKQLVLPKPNWEIDAERLSSLETKTEGLQVCIFPPPWKGISGPEP